MKVVVSKLWSSAGRVVGTRGAILLRIKIIRWWCGESVWNKTIFYFRVCLCACVCACMVYINKLDLLTTTGHKPISGPNAFPAFLDYWWVRCCSCCCCRWPVVVVLALDKTRPAAAGRRWRCCCYKIVVIIPTTRKQHYEKENFKHGR